MLDKPPKLRRLLGMLCVVVIGWCVALFAYGFISFPLAPYKPCGMDGYCDKVGHPHSAADFEAFSRWETLLKLSWPFGIAAAFLGRRLRRDGR